MAVTGFQALFLRRKRNTTTKEITMTTVPTDPNEIMQRIQGDFIEFVQAEKYPRDQAEADEATARFVADMERKYNVTCTGKFNLIDNALVLNIRTSTAETVTVEFQMTAHVEDEEPKPTSMNDLNAAITPTDTEKESVKTHTAASIRQETIREVAAYLRNGATKRRGMAKTLCVLGQHADGAMVNGVADMYECVAGEMLHHFKVKS